MIRFAQQKGKTMYTQELEDMIQEHGFEVTPELLALVQTAYDLGCDDTY